MANKNVMTTETNPHPVNSYLQKDWLLQVQSKILYEPLGEEMQMPQNEGDTCKWFRIMKMADATTPMGELEGPSPVLLSRTEVNATIRQYGNGIKTSQWLDMTGLKSENLKRSDELIDNAAQSLDTIARNVTAGGASQTTCSNGTDGTVTHLNRTDIDAVVNTLVGQDAQMLRPQIDASVKVGTSPIREAYIVIAHTNARPYLENVTGFKHVSTYAQQGGLMPGEFGSVGDTRWCLTTKGYYDGSTYYHATFFARGFFGNLRMTGKGSSKAPLIYTPPDRTGDPYQMYSTLVWKVPYAAMILDDRFGHVLRYTV